MPPSNARALAEAIPGARLLVLEGAGHPVFVDERAAEVNRGVSAFLAGGRSAGPGRVEGAEKARVPKGGEQT